MNSHICSAYALGTKARRAQFIASAISRFNCKLDHDTWKPSLHVYRLRYRIRLIQRPSSHPRGII